MVKLLHETEKQIPHCVRDDAGCFDQVTEKQIPRCARNDAGVTTFGCRISTRARRFTPKGAGRASDNKNMKLAIEGMHCQACVARVRKAIEKVEGARVDNVAIGAAEVHIDSSRQPVLIEAIRRAGYEPRETD